MNDALHNFDPDMSRPSAAPLDVSRQAATNDEYISIKEAQAIFLSRNRPITERTLQRYCDKHHFDAQKRMTNEGEKWFVTRSSVLRRIAELEAFDKLNASRQVATSRDASSQVAPENAPHHEDTHDRLAASAHVSSPIDAQEVSHTTRSDQSPHDATNPDVSRENETRNELEKSATDNERELYERMLLLLEEQREDLMKDKVMLQSDKEALLRQLEMKDKQIDRFFASERDTKTLMGSLQSLVSALWPKGSKGEGERYAPVRDALESGLPEHHDEAR